MRGIAGWVVAATVCYPALLGCGRRATPPPNSHIEQTPVGPRYVENQPAGAPAGASASIADSSPGFTPRFERGKGIPQPAGQLPSVELESLTPVDSGPGILVCEPAGVGRNLLAFGAGAARWLQFWIGGSGALGKTPMWSSVEYVLRELHRGDLRLTLSHAPRLSTALGITHAAFGTIAGSPARCTLTYRLIRLDRREAVGPPIVLSGAEATVAAQLPDLARELCTRLRVAAPRIPASPSETADQLTQIGSFPWIPKPPIGRAQLDRLDRLSHRSAVAALLFVINRGETHDTGILTDAADLLRGLAPENPLALAEIGRQFRDADAGTPPMRLKPGIDRFPNSYLYATAACWSHRALGDVPAAVRAATHAVRCAPSNPDAWRTLAGTFDYFADVVRRGRTNGELQPGELEYCRRLYHLELPPAVKATELDPRNAYSWDFLSGAAAFGGQRTLADRAFWKALDLAPDDPSILQWGLDLYQPKWLGDREKAARVADLAVRAAARAGGAWTSTDRAEVARSATKAGFPEVAARINGSQGGGRPPGSAVRGQREPQ